MKPTIGFIGMTHLGVNSAAASAAKGFETLCFDLNPSLIEACHRGKLPVVEPGLLEELEAHRGKLTYTAHLPDLKACTIVYLASDVATDEFGQSDHSTTVQLLELAIPHVSSDAILVILCQVPPGFTRKVAFPKERLFYQVETLVFGRAVERANNPERIIVGSVEPEKPFPRSYQSFLEAFKCPVLPMRYESAELAKIAINCCLVGMMSVANTLSELCECIDADWAEILPALQMDKRIGQYAYLQPGLGFAGGNLERDLATVRRLSEEHGTEAGVVRAWVTNSQYRRDWVLRLLHDKVLSRHSEIKIAVLGLAYKENTHSTKNSPSVSLISCLKDWTITVYDPVVPASVVDHPKLTMAHTVVEAVRGADVLIIMTPWQEFKELQPFDLAKMMAGRTVIDPYQVLARKACRAAGLDYFTLGLSSQRMKGCPNEGA